MMARAKRGDLAALIAVRHDYVIGQPTSQRTTVEIHEVTSVTREGAVKAVRRLDSDYSTPIERCHGVTQRLLIPAAVIDKPAAVQTILAHTWPGHESMKPYDSIEEARAALRPHLVSA